MASVLVLQQFYKFETALGRVVKWLQSYGSFLGVAKIRLYTRSETTMGALLNASRKVEPKVENLVGVERAAGALLLAVAAPVIAVSGVAIYLLSGRSPFIAHRRVGEGGRLFWMWKLRTMWPAKGSRVPSQSVDRAWVEYIVAEPVSDVKDPQDGRVTSAFARFLRRHSIDEIPQLWHVARGEMSLVGPRPLTRTEVDRHYGARAAELLSVKPGITGLWQISGRNTVKFPERAEMDLELVNSLTVRSYFSILLRTLPALFHGKGAW
jgi:lipopolysaccharide/colanic/teichoic acid biosynthesis glycosyltransferase